MRSGLVSVGGRASRILVAILTTMVLARLLGPRDFGLMAMVGTLTAFVGSFSDFGLPMAILHREGLASEEADSVFWFGARLGLIVLVVIWVAAPGLAWFYDEPSLVPLTAVAGTAVFLTALGAQPLSVVKRRMQFGRAAMLEIGSLTLAGALAVALALAGMGVWALVLQSVAAALLLTIGAWLISGWRPRRAASREQKVGDGVRAMLSYGGFFTGARLIGHIGRNLDRILIGYLSGAGPLGLYEKAFSWSQFSAIEPYISLKDVIVATLSRVNRRARRYRAYALLLLSPLVAASVPALVFLMMEAEAVIAVLLGPQWRDAVPLFQWLCLAALFMVPDYIGRLLYLSSGRTRRMFEWTVASTLVLVAAVAVGARAGTTGVAIGVAVATASLAVPGLALCLRGSVLGWSEIAALARVPTVATAAAAVGLGLARSGLEPFPAAARLVLGGCLFGAAYLVTTVTLPGGRRGLLRLIRRRDLWRSSLNDHA